MEKKTGTYNYYVEAEKIPFVENILARRGISYKWEEGRLYVDLNSKKFHQVIVRAGMEQLQKKTGSSIPHIAESELTDWTVLDEVGDVYVVKYQKLEDV